MLSVLPLALLAIPLQGALRLQVLPGSVYKAATVQRGYESFTFNVLVVGSSSVEPQPELAVIELRSDDHWAQRIELSADELEAVRGVTFRPSEGSELSGKLLSNIPEQFDLRHHFVVPTPSRIDRVRYTLKLNLGGTRLYLNAEFPVTVYAPKNPLIFPIKGTFTVPNGPVEDFGHTERSQQFALDIVGLNPQGALVRTAGLTNEDFYGWGREVLSPESGEVVYARNDVPDQPRPGVIDKSLFQSLDEPVLAAGGNFVVIDHGQGEFSYLAHMQKGSVRVKPGDRVERGQMLGRLGNSGNANGPHLHYHLMNGPGIYRCDGLPAVFTNISAPPDRGTINEAK